MDRRDHLVLGIEAAVFVAAAAVHLGVATGIAHMRAAAAEAVIAICLVAGLLAGRARPELSRGLALAVQTFAVLGTLVGLVAIAFGLGPQTLPDLLLHLGVLTLLAFGLLLTTRAA